jgi:DNA helicase-2/ATP-dependent DNA helicase PcrA
MKTYDKEQLKAINACGGYYLVLAPPGCGKTDILSERIVRAKQQGVGFEDMLCLTFTNRASRGMRDRVKQKVGEEACNIFVGNVHRYCSNFLYNNALVPENSSIIDEDDLADILLSFDSTLFLNKKGSPDKMKVSLVDNIDAYITQRQMNHPTSAIFLPEEFDRYYQIAKNANFDPNRVDSLNQMVKYALLYHQYKAERNIISFSDILILAYEGLRKDTAREYKRYSWIQVDEVQDLNALQTAIIDELLDKSTEFTVMYLGDEQQAIFSFLGAKLGQLQLLKQRCAGHIMTLGTNYRSPKYLLDIFNTYAEDELDVDSSLLPQSTRDIEYDKFDLILTGNPTIEDEDERITKMIEYYLRFDDERVAILVPTNDAADRISEKLNSEGITHFKISGTDMFKTKSYKTLSSFFCVNANDFNNLAWARLLHGIGAIRTGASARGFLAKLKDLMMTPSDLFVDMSYIARFNKEYETKEFVFFDTETTGLNVLEDDIVQIAAFKVNKGQIVPGSDFVIFLDTDKEIPVKLGDIDNPLIEAYANNPHHSREEGLKMFIDYIGDCPLLGHNVNYDYRILQKNVERELNEQVTYDIYDSLHLIKCVEPNLRMYKLAFLLKELQLEGKNSHLADEDIAATKALVDYCYQKSQSVIPQQLAFVSQIKVKNVIAKMMPLLPLIENLQDHLYQPVQTIGRTIADELMTIYDDMVSMQMIQDLGNKFNVFLQFVQSEWVDYENEQTIFDEISNHINDMTASISEGDLVNSEDLIHDRIFIMTVYKGKGLEFDNVVILEANDGTYPYFMVNKILEAPYRYEPEEVAKAEIDRKEDARKFYVALSRAKKRLCISYTDRNPWGYLTRMTPFMNCIERYFYTGRANTSKKTFAAPVEKKEFVRRNINGSDLTFIQDKLISFEDSSHTYNVIGVGEMRPVSSVIALFFEPFNAEEVSIRKCQGDLTAAAKLREEWDAKGSFASQAGTFLHKQIENYLNNKLEPQTFKCDVEYNGKYLHLNKRIDISKEWAYFKAFDMATTYQPFRTEWCVFDKEARMAGTVDLICARPDGTYELYDWKRSNKVNPNEANQWSKGINGLEHLSDTSYSHYCLQQNLYRYMLEKNYGIKISRMNLVVLHPDYMSYNVVPVPIMDHEVRIVISYLKSNP